MSVPTAVVACVGKRVLAPGVYELRLSKPIGFKFLPGQFVLFDVPSLEDPADVQPRAYSIASSPAEDELLFVIKLVRNGRASAWVERAVEPGTPVVLRGPFGRFTLDLGTTKDYLFVATGTGIAPLRSQILWNARERGDARRMHLAVGVLRPEDRFWQEEWSVLRSQFPQLSVNSFVLQEGQSLLAHLPQVVEDFTGVSVYLCGAPETVQALKGNCMDWGVPKHDLHAESYM